MLTVNSRQLVLYKVKDIWGMLHGPVIFFPEAVITIPGVPFSQRRNVIPHPKPGSYPKEFKAIGDHIRAWRMNKTLNQADVAGTLGVCEDTIAYWEKRGALPKVQQMPCIIQMIGYIPVNIATSTLAGRVKYYRIRLGKTQEEFAKELGVNESTVFHYEKGVIKLSSKHTTNLRLC